MSVVPVYVRVFFWGLVAFVPDKQKDPTEITALLIDAATPQMATDGCPVFPHTASLYYHLPANKLCDPSSDCKLEGRFCVCPLNRVDLQIPSATPGASVKGDFSLVASMTRISRGDAAVRPDLLTKVYDKGAPSVLGARVSEMFVTGAIRAVRMVGESEGHAPEAYFSFESLVDRPTFLRPHRECRMAEAISVPMLVTGSEEGGRVTIKLLMGRLDPGGGLLPLVIEAVSCGDHKFCADLFVVNEMDETAFNLTQGLCHNESIGRHFELYYGLSRRSTDFDSRDVPKKVVGRCGDNRFPVDSSIQGLLAGPEMDTWLEFLKDLGRAGEHRPICPMVTMTE